MSKTINFEITSIDTELKEVTLNSEDSDEICMDIDHLPENLKEGRFLRFIISHTDYNPDKPLPDEVFDGDKPETKNHIVSGHQLSY